MTEDRTLHGIGVSPGLAFAPAVVIEWRFPDVPDRSIEPHEADGEIVRLHAAVRGVVEHLDVLRERVRQRAGEAESGIFDAQILMAQDPDFLASVEYLIRHNHLSAETAYEFKALEMRVAWSGTGNVRLRERLADLSAIQMRVLRSLMGRTDEELWVGDLEEQVIVVAHELSPGLTVQLDRDHLVGLVSEEGTRTSHAAILAHSLGIPAVMGATGAIERIASGTVLLLDGHAGTVVLDPTRDELDQARRKVTRRQKMDLEFEGALAEPTVTPDGREISLLANVDLPEEIDLAVRYGARGVGLLRTEFFVTGKAHLPSEDDQAEYFRRVATAFGHDFVTIRTYDLGGDKFPAAFEAPSEANPFLGWRSIRVCLDHPEIFRPQLRAILRAAHGRNVRVMIPLVTRVDEVVATRAMLAEESERLRRAGVPAADTVPVGVMVETPAAVVLADRIAAVSDFFSVGTNDLTQYTLAVDRGNARLAPRFTPHDPAILRQLRDVLAAAAGQGIPVSVCGEMATAPLGAILLVGLGFTELSISPPALPMLNWVLRAIPYQVCRDAVEVALGADSSDAITAAMLDVVGPYCDVRVLGS